MKRLYTFFGWCTDNILLFSCQPSLKNVKKWRITLFAHFLLYSNRPFSHIPHLTTTASSTIKCTKCCLLGTLHLLMSNQNLFEQNYDFAYFMSFEQQIISDSLSTRHFEYVNGVKMNSNSVLEEKTGFCPGILTGTFRSKIQVLLWISSIVMTGLSEQSKWKNTRFAIVSD